MSDQSAFRESHQSLSMREQHTAIMKGIDANIGRNSNLPAAFINLPGLNMMFQFANFRVEGFPDKPEFIGYANFENSYGSKSLLIMLRPSISSDIFDIIVWGDAAGSISQDECWEIMSFGACRWKVLVGKYPNGFSSDSQRHPHYVAYNHSRDKDFYPGSLRHFA